MLCDSPAVAVMALCNSADGTLGPVAVAVLRDSAIVAVAALYNSAAALCDTADCVPVTDSTGDTAASASSPVVNSARVPAAVAGLHDSSAATAAALVALHDTAIATPNINVATSTDSRNNSRLESLTDMPYPLFHQHKYNKGNLLDAHIE